MLMRPLFTLPLPDIVIQTLRKGGFRYHEDLIKRDGVYKDKVLELVQKVNYKPSELEKLIIPSLIDTAGQLLQNEALVSHIPTFSQSLDRILGGGVPSSSVLQVCGGPGSGKTQFLLQLCVNVQLPECFGGLEGASIYIDTDSGFAPTRLREIAEGAVSHCSKIAAVHCMEEEVGGFAVDSILKNVHYVIVKNHIELLAAVEKLHHFISNHPQVKLVVIDSIIFPFLTSNNNLERTRLLYLLMNKMSRVAEQFNIPVVFTNHLTTKIFNNSKFLAQALGEALAHRVPQTLLFAKVQDTLTAVLCKSSSAPDVVVQFCVTDQGIRDVCAQDENETFMDSSND